ncbi:amidohydrolase family protein, partial [Endozoicomonas sp. SESOKO4]|uniref:amidohydrolase family protein n=1 Tax=Endozoicomonas sp. SESOKO4 TaxID=2828745 RepID=UPI0021487195
MIILFESKMRFPTRFIWPSKKLLQYSMIVLCAAHLAACRDNVDFIVAGDYVVTMNDQAEVIEQGAVVVDDGKIIAVGPAQAIYDEYQSTHILRGEGRVLLPGLINGHTHTAMTLFRGIADDTELMTWLEETIFPLEAAFVTPEFIEVGAELACYEMISSGTTTFVDMYFYPEIIAQVVERCGLRAILTAPMIDYPSPWFEGWDDSFAAGVA